MLTRLFSYLWDRCLPTNADDLESLFKLLELEQRQHEFMKNLEALLHHLPIYHATIYHYHTDPRDNGTNVLTRLFSYVWDHCLPTKRVSPNPLN